MAQKATAQDISIFKGQTVTFVLTVLDEDADPFDLTGSLLFLRVKNKVTDADPAIIELAVGSGITLRTQTGTDIGKADVVITSTQTNLLTTQENVYDVWLEKPSGERSAVVPVSKLTRCLPVTNL